MIRRYDFDDIIQLAMADAGVGISRQVVEKEVLHHDIFRALDRAGLLTHLVFMGGTALRLCYGSTRYSEDLDFAGGFDFSAKQLDGLADAVEDFLMQRYGLERFQVEISEPRPESRIQTWQVTVQTAPQNRAIPRQRIKIDVEPYPAKTAILTPLQTHYPSLAGGAPTMVRTETREEILAGKAISLSASLTDGRIAPRYRDIWDIAWLRQQGAKLDGGLLVDKMSDRNLLDHAAEIFESGELALGAAISDGRFSQEMKRFLPGDVLSRTLDKPGFLDYLSQTVGDVIRGAGERVREREAQTVAGPTFEM
jgi:predicted nucleotidyltransferase component of viral defense system